MTCTWVDCSNPAVHPWKNKSNEVWANLCEDHNRKLDDSINDMLAGDKDEHKVKVHLSYWVKAHGGSKKMMERMR